MELKVISFNIKNNFLRSRKEIIRINDIADFLKQHNADIIGLQEVNEKTRMELKTLLPEYEFIGDSRYTKNYKWNKSTTILLNKKRFKILNTSTFWLNEKPEMQYSRNRLSMFPRICTYVEVELDDIERIRIFNTHLDHVFPSVRRMQFKTILQYVAELQHTEHLPLIGLGDLNTRYHKRNITYFKQIIKEYQLDIKAIYDYYPVNISTHPWFHNEEGYPIDYIFLTPEFEVLDFSLLHAQGNPELSLSDHLPLICILELSDSKSGEKLI